MSSEEEPPLRVTLFIGNRASELMAEPVISSSSSSSSDSPTTSTAQEVEEEDIRPVTGSIVIEGRLEVESDGRLKVTSDDGEIRRINQYYSLGGMPPSDGDDIDIRFREPAPDGTVKAFIKPKEPSETGRLHRLLSRSALVRASDLIREGRLSRSITAERPWRSSRGSPDSHQQFLDDLRARLEEMPPELLGPLQQRIGILVDDTLRQVTEREEQENRLPEPNGHGGDH